jgi:7,8-dihydro-6-hydroxymethylpterin dimethyltransferase
VNVAVENYARIKSTLSICPTCLESIEADVVERDGQVWMHKHCPTHGDFSALLASDARHYYQSSGSTKAGGSCCGIPSSNSALSNHSCTVLIEICERCNLSCPTCFAGSSPAHSRMMDLETYQARIDGLVASGKQTADVIQLSGGEPTIHPQLIDILTTTFASGFLKVTINSNGIKLAQEEFVRQLSECVSAFPDAKLYIYLQFDGFDDRTHSELRGRSDLLELKRRALVNCIRAGFIVHPVMTLTRGINDHEVGEFVALAMDHPQIKHVVIQPAMYSGRYEHARRMDRLTLADAVALVVDQFGVFGPEDFGPIPCSHPNCHGVAVAVRTDSGLIPVSRYFPRHQDWEAPEAQNLIAAFTDTLNGRDGFAAAMQWVMDDQRTADSLQGLDDETVEVLLDAMASGEPGGGEIWDRMLTVSIKPFMDAWTYDQDRINKCCVHILDEDGTPISLCEYNAVTRPQQTLQGGSYA